MKLYTTQFTLSFVLLLIVLSSSAIYAGQENTANPAQANPNSVYKHKSPDGHHQVNTSPTELKTNKKKILIEESREMSSFFKLGIAINIIMILVFAWWFRKEWRSKK